VKKFISCIVLSLAAIAPAAAAPELPGVAAAQSSSQVPLKVQIVVTRYQGEKKVSSVPYTLAVVANDGDKTSLRMGVDVPVPQTVFTAPAKAGETTSVPTTSYSYRSVGTNIDCTARSAEAGMFKLDLAVSDTSVFMTPREGSVTTAAAGVPAFRSFTSSFHMLLKDGQTAQHTTATDAVSGEVLKLDVTLTVLK
jgi:type II secretory pathway component GspD/PulD (secretin)